MIVLETIAVAFAMFSAIPCPQPIWNEKNMRFMMVAFPLVGVVCGALCGGWFVLMQFLAAPTLLQGAGFCLIPVLVTGGIHLDGYADTCDARASCAPPEKKREILKDPRCGAFAVIHLCAWFVADFTLCACIRWEPRVLWCLGLGFVLERCLSGIAVASFPMAKKKPAHTFAAASIKESQSLPSLLALGLTLALILVGR
ncbi:MAG: adenosylcobinamide-GDP ribazoletransferase [Acutalibacteraceae bacterium]